ncbi:MAG: hypothetical protein JNL03_12395 [Prolixibacteraceae bacterium]|nr:hypothetical protein [Prolixibacteraceae bacterium]
MGLAIWIARTNVFFLCYLPLLVAAGLVSGRSVPEKGICFPARWIRLLGGIAGMIVAEIAFSFLLIAQHELSFNFKSTSSGWNVLAIELLLAIAVFTFFFGMSIAANYFFRKIVRH